MNSCSGCTTEFGKRLLVDRGDKSHGIAVHLMRMRPVLERLGLENVNERSVSWRLFVEAQ